MTELKYSKHKQTVELNLDRILEEIRKYKEIESQLLQSAKNTPANQDNFENQSARNRPGKPPGGPRDPNLTRQQSQTLKR